MIDWLRNKNIVKMQIRCRDEKGAGVSQYDANASNERAGEIIKLESIVKSAEKCMSPITQW